MKRSNLSGIGIVFLSTLLLVSYSFAGGPKSKPFLPDIPDEWIEITPGPTEYMGRDLVPTCSGYPGTDSEFSFFARSGTVNNLVVFFDGGGACWDWLTCLYYPIYSKEVDETTDGLANAGGIFDTNNPDNPFKDWSFVFIPYCTGDIHWGSNDPGYLDLLGGFGGGVIPIHHRGFDNFLVVLKWVEEHFKKPHKIFVTGSSAGSYGALIGFPWLQEAYPQSKVSVLGDAGMGISPVEFQLYSRTNWDVQLPEWIFGDDTLDITTPDIWKMIAEYYPNRKLAQYTNAWDYVQILFYDLILQTLGMDPDEENVCVDWNMKMYDAEYYKQEALNYRSYVASGAAHTIMGTDQFYTEDSAGVPFLDWVETMVRNQGGTHGHGGVPWENVECEDCDPLIPCPF